MDDDRLTSIVLASKGYGGGDPDAVLQMPVETVLDVMAVVAFEGEYLSTKAELNKPEGNR